MARRLRSVLLGMGSIFVIMPPAGTRPQILMDRTERMRRPWARTGQAIRRAIDRFEREHQVKA